MILRIGFKCIERTIIALTRSNWIAYITNTLKKNIYSILQGKLMIISKLFSVPLYKICIDKILTIQTNIFKNKFLKNIIFINII